MNKKETTRLLVELSSITIRNTAIQLGYNPSNVTNGLASDKAIEDVKKKMIQDVKKISKLVHRHEGLLHIDATQSFGHIPIDVEELGVTEMVFYPVLAQILEENETEDELKEFCKNLYYEGYEIGKNLNISM